LLRHADENLMDLVDALGVEGTNLGETLEIVRRMLAQATREYAADREARGIAYGQCIAALTKARTALIIGYRDACTDSLNSLDTCLRDFLAEKGSEGR
jgi:hypothetical protein